MHLLFSRHGDTFEPGQKVVWVGSKNDLPLASKGKEQARELAHQLQKRNLSPIQIICAPLLRTREYGQIIIDELGLPISVKVDARLSELDYGEWSGLSSEEISLRFGKEVLENWEKNSVWPKVCGWKSSEGEVLRELRELLAECRTTVSEKDLILFVTSNGRLRFLLKLIAGEFESRLARQDFKVKTGNIGLLEDCHRELTLHQWNVPPAELRLKG
ncbi:MAG: histidine phosphatase family protein [Deltaproteobacteria bacterium]|nr:histidine phosphatase family protein [Deltaproteobacteria bacterium]